MLASMRILLLSSLSLLPAVACAAAAETVRNDEAPALAAAISTCDKGASVPLDSTAKAPPVQYYELFPADLDMRKLEALQKACQQAWAGEPKTARLQLEWLRVSAALGKPDQLWLILPQIKIFADSGNAEAQFLMFRLFKPHPAEGEAAPMLTADMAIAYLKKAAEQGHMTALNDLMNQYRGGGLLRRDLKEAVRIGRRIDGAPPQGVSETPYETRMRASIAVTVAGMTLEEDGFTPAEQRIAFGILDKDSASGSNGTFSALIYLKALRQGRSTAADPARVRQILEARLTRFRDGVPMLADMLARGEGGPADPKRALALLRGPDGRVYGAAQVLASLLLDGKAVGRQPQEAIRLLAPSWDVADQIRVAGLLVDYNTRLENPNHLVEILSDAADAGDHAAALALARLKLSDNSQFNDIDGARALLKPLADGGDRDALWLYAGSQYGNLEVSSSQAYRRPDGWPDDQLKQVIADGMEKKQAEAFLLRARLTRKGVVYPQDDQAATNLLISAANLGSIKGMVLLGNAYSNGLGTPKNPRERLHAWREAARNGSLVARQNLANAFTFDTFDKLMTLEEGVTGPLVLYINGSDDSAALGGDLMASARLGSMFSFGSRAMEAGAPAVAEAVMNAFAEAPSGLEDKRLVTIGKALPDEIRIAIETRLAREHFYSGEPNGYFGPEARAALAAWVEARGPSGTRADADDAGKTAPAVTAKPLVDAETVARLRDAAFNQAKAARSDRQKLTSLSTINALAAYGDMSARWALVRNYNQARVVRKIVSAQEITRYALDVLITRPPEAEKAEIEVVFDITQMAQDGRIGVFGKAVLAAVRDDVRLQDPLTLGGLLKQLVFAPGACDAVLDAATKARIKDVGQDGCDDATLAALIAFAKARGPSGIDAAARKAAATELLAMDREAAK
jgi:TPR repeat protein